MYLDIQELSQYLNIKRSTLYAWAAQGRIPHVKICRLIRFRKEEIDAWVECFRKARSEATVRVGSKRTYPGDVDILIARAKREVYNSPRVETRPKSAQRKEGNHGAV